eukprot:768732-Hanusia_phi.AAC.5
MSKYIFPGADASTPLNWYVKQCELAGFEVTNESCSSTRETGVEVTRGRFTRLRPSAVTTRTPSTRSCNGG